jgi:hypothetical protein
MKPGGKASSADFLAEGEAIKLRINIVKLFTLPK